LQKIYGKKRQRFFPFWEVILLIFPFLFLFFGIVSRLALAQTAYDPYVPISQDDLQERTRKTRQGEFFKPLGDIAALPFEVLKLGMDPILYELETRHVPRKLTWIIEKLADRGIVPKLSGGGLGAGVGLDLESVKLFGLSEAFRSLV